MEHFKKLQTPPYFLTYEVVETETSTVTDLFGTLVASGQPVRRRQVGIDLRVGTYALDNTHPIWGARQIFADQYNAGWPAGTYPPVDHLALPKRAPNVRAIAKRGRLVVFILPPETRG